MAFTIRTPVESDTYLLTADLAKMAGDISGYLTDLNGQIILRPKINDDVSFGKITANTDITTPIIYIGSSTALFKTPYPKIPNNSTDGFGLISGNLGTVAPIKFTTKDNLKWTSTVPIAVPAISYTKPLPAYKSTTVPTTTYNTFTINFDTFYRLLQDLDFRYASYAEASDAFDKVYAEIATKADRYNNSDVWVANANNANYATSAGALKTADGKVRDFNAGVWPATTSADLFLDGGKNQAYTIDHGLSGANIPMVFVNPIFDDGQYSIRCNVQKVTATNFTVNCENINSSTGEHFRLALLAIAN